MIENEPSIVDVLITNNNVLIANNDNLRAEIRSYDLEKNMLLDLLQLIKDESITFGKITFPTTCRINDVLAKR